MSISIGNKLKTLRKGQGLTQQELSERLGLSRAKSVFFNKDIPKEEKEDLYKSIMKMYLEIE